MTTLGRAKQRYAQEGIASKIEQEGKGIDEARGQVLDHDKDRRAVHQRLRARAVKDAYITFAGPLIRPGYEVMFSCGSF